MLSDDSCGEIQFVGAKDGRKRLALNAEVPLGLVNELQLSGWGEERWQLLTSKTIKTLKSSMDFNNKTLCLHVYLSNSLSTFILKHAISFFFFFR